MNCLKTIFPWFAGLALTGLVLNVFGIVGIHYLRAVENNPFPVMVYVKSIDNERIELVDGRIVRCHGEIRVEDQEVIRDSGGKIGLKADEYGNITLFARRSRTICGTGMPIFSIPLIPCDVPKYIRRIFAMGEIENFGHPPLGKH